MEEANKILATDIYINNKLTETYIASSRNDAKRKIHLDRGKKLFVGGLSPNTTRKTLFSFFEKFAMTGQLNRAYVIHDSQTQCSRCFGFLEFDNEIDPKVILDKRFFQLDGHTIEVKSMLLRKELHILNGTAQNSFLRKK